MKRPSLWIFIGLLALTAVAIHLSRSRDDRSAVWAVDANELREQQVQGFRDLHPELEIRLDPSQPDLTKVLVQSIGGVGPDLFCVYDPAMLTAAVKSGIAEDLTDEVASWGVDLDQLLWPGCMDSIRYNGRIYGLPNNIGPVGMWINEDAFTEARVPIPEGEWTWEEFIAIGDKLNQRGPDGRIERYAFTMDWNSWPHFLMQWGGSCYSPDGTRSTLDSPEAIAAIQFMYDLVYRHHLAPTPNEESSMATAGGWGRGTLPYFANGRFATALGGRWWLMMLRQYPELKYRAVESPHGPVRVNQCTSKATLLNAKSRHPETGRAFLKHLLSPEYNELIQRQGDALGPVKSIGAAEPELAVWREMMTYSRPIDRSDFINGLVANRLVSRQLDLVKNQLKSPEKAMRDAAREINLEIKRTVLEDPELLRRYTALTGKTVTREELQP